VIWVYTAAGLVVFVIVLALLVGAIQSVKSKGSFAVRLDVPEYYGYSGELTARVDSMGEALMTVSRWKAMIDQHEKGDDPEPPTSIRESLTRRGLLP
jgi:hypothetical protein